MIQKLIWPGQWLRDVYIHKPLFGSVVLCHFNSHTTPSAFSVSPHAWSNTVLLSHAKMHISAHMKKHVLPSPEHIHPHTSHTHQRACGEARCSLFLRAGAMSCQIGLAFRQLMSQSSFWSLSRGLWFTCSGCQVLPWPLINAASVPI